MYRHVRKGGARLPLLLVFALAAIAAWMLVAVGPAAAAPSNTMNLTDLQTAITNAGAGGLDGYFETVLQGATITPVSVKILAVADGQNPEDGSPLILFQINDTTVLNLGGLAEGMSGSPLFIGSASDPQPDTDYLVGAVSYGDIFTTNGLGLATPIDLMASIENYPVAPVGATLKSVGSPAAPQFEAAGPVLPKTRTVAPARPLATGAGTIRRIVLARSHAVAHTLHPAAGTVVFAPLSALEIGGLPANSRAFKTLASQFAKRGVDVIAAGLGAGLGDSGDFSTPIVGGASVAAVLCRGDVWSAFVGTVTYVDGDVVVAFGHPADYDGSTSLEMANAYIYGIWSNTLDPYKICSLGAPCGTVTQDRLYGIAGVTSSLPTEIPVTAQATLGGNTVPSMTVMPQWVADNPDYGSMFISDACYAPVFKITDSYSFPGTATTMTKVTMADPLPATTTYDATVSDVWDDTYDVGYYATFDAQDMVDYLTSNPNGTAPGVISAVDFTADLSPAQRSTEVLDFSVPGGLRTGANTIRAIVRDYGEVGTHEVDLPLYIPAKTQTTGSIDVEGYGDGWGYDDYYDDSSDFAVRQPAQRTADVPGIFPIADSPSLADLVTDVNAWESNDDLDVSFDADVDNQNTVPVGPDGVPVNEISSSTAITDGGAPWFVEGYVEKDTPDFALQPQKRFVQRGHTVRLVGMLEASDANGTTVAIYKGSGTKPIANVRVSVDPGGNGHFSLKVKLGRSTTTYRAVWDGSLSYIGARTSCKVRVLPGK